MDKFKIRMCSMETGMCKCPWARPEQTGINLSGELHKIVEAGEVIALQIDALPFYKAGYHNRIHKCSNPNAMLPFIQSTLVPYA
jgi:hypothetical protein